MSIKPNLAQRLRARLDSWQNLFTGLGTSGRDKMVATQFLQTARLPDETLEALYHQEDMAARIAETLPEEALRKGWEVSITDDEQSDIPDALDELMERIGFKASFLDAAIWGRVFGGALLYLGIDDGQDPSMPVNEENIRAIRFATVLDKRDLIPDSVYEDVSRYGEVETYRIATVSTPAALSGIATTGAGFGSVIHESRVLRFEGSRTSSRRATENSGWSDSVLEKVHEVLLQFNTGWQATGHLLADASQGVFKLHGLIDMVSGGDKDVLATRMELVDMSRSVARALVLDAETEDFQRQNFSFAGLPEVLEKFMMRLAAAARMPLTVLMGRSPAGMNATGESDIRLWYDRIQSYQSDVLAPRLRRFVHLALKSQELGVAEPESWQIKFNSLWQLTDHEQAELEKRTAEKDEIYIRNQVLMPEEVALNRFRSSGFSLDTQIDLDTRQEILNADLEATLNGSTNGLDDPPSSGDPSTEGLGEGGGAED